ncbi:MAG: tRNA pseudouridine(13) synthase TruD [Leptospiraceae bacterium]|nr:tRNA pseudouridine(13) synthase TruD [Leptospiraceae bacterium]
MTSYAGFLAYRLKMQPEDFRVEELTHIRKVESSRFRLYELKKTSWNTVDAILRISREANISLKKFNYGGKKDRHATTKQFITVEHPQDLSGDFGGYSLKALGFAAEPMTPDFIRGNRFSITVRNVLEREIRAIEGGFHRLADLGFPNYFDDQRFGSFHPVVGFSFLSLYRDDPESALRFTLLSPFGGEKPHAKKRKKAIHDCWGNWNQCLEFAETRPEKAILQELQKRKAIAGSADHKKIYLELLDRLPAEELSMGFSALQSWIFNESLARLLRQGDDLKTWSRPRQPAGLIKSVEIKTKTGDQCFPISLDSDILNSIRDAQCWLLGPRKGGQHQSSSPGSRNEREAALEQKSADLCRILDQKKSEMLEILEIPEERFSRSLLRNAFLKSHLRPLWCIPEDLEMGPFESDELNSGKLKYSISFVLPKGVYATMAMKSMHLRLKGQK